MYLYSITCIPCVIVSQRTKKDHRDYTNWQRSPRCSRLLIMLAKWCRLSAYAKTMQWKVLWALTADSPLAQVTYVGIVSIKTNNMRVCKVIEATCAHKRARIGCAHGQINFCAGNINNLKPFEHVLINRPLHCGMCLQSKKKKKSVSLQFLMHTSFNPSTSEYDKTAIIKNY